MSGCVDQTCSLYYILLQWRTEEEGTRPDDGWGKEKRNTGRDVPWRLGRRCEETSRPPPLVASSILLLLHNLLQSISSCVENAVFICFMQISPALHGMGKKNLDIFSAFSICGCVISHSAHAALMGSSKCL